MVRVAPYYTISPPIDPNRLLVVGGTLFETEETRADDLTRHVARIPVHDGQTSFNSLHAPGIKDAIDAALERISILIHNNSYKEVLYFASPYDEFSFGNNRKLDRSVQAYIVKSLRELN